MSVGRSKADLLQFIDWEAAKGLIPANTASSRKAAANKALAILSDEEAQDVTDLDVDDVILRFSNKLGQNYSPESILAYKSRLRSALADFKEYCSSPVGFRPQARSPVRSQSPREKPVVRRPIASTTAVPENEVAPPISAAVHILPITIRPDLTVQIRNLPHDLTSAEASRIANVVRAYAVPDG